MPSAELAPEPTYATPETHSEALPHFSIPGFEKLPYDAQARYLKIPPAMLERARPLIEAKIAEYAEGSEDISEGCARIGEGKNERSEASNREAMAVAAIDTFHRAEQGDPKAKKDLQDAEKELLDKEPSDEDVFKTILETQSSDPFAQDMVIEVMLTDAEAKATQDVLDLFKEFRGDLLSVDDALSPKQQIDFFTLVTKGRGSLPERMDFARKVLEFITHDGQENLFEGLTECGALNGLELNENVVERVVSEAEKSHSLGPKDN